jgi:hypothetical protein
VIAMAAESSEIFISTAVHYYIAGRYAVFAGLNPTAGNLLHHAIEMCLKGALAKKGWSLDDLKDRLGHNLPKIWRAFKAQHLGTLTEFDAVVSELDRFEEIRYPNSILKHGMLCEIDPGQRPSTHKPTGLKPTEPRYALYLGEIDPLFAKVFELASINFQAFTPMMLVAKRYLNERNDVESLKAK